MTFSENAIPDAELGARFDPAQLPPVSPLVNDLLGLDLDDETAGHTLLLIVESDPQLSLRLIGIANSAAYAHLGSALRTVTDAMRRIGLTRTQHLAIGMLFGAPLRGKLTPRLAQDIWLHALTVAASANEIARLKRNVDVGTAYLCGLVHDLGYMAEEILSPGALRRLPELSLSGQFSLEQAEQKLFGCEHSELTARIIRHWSAPPDIVEAVVTHHDLDIQPDSLAATLFGAEKLARFSDVTTQLYADEWHPFAGMSIDRDGLDFLFHQQLALNADEVSRLADNIVDQVESFRECARAICAGH